MKEAWKECKLGEVCENIYSGGTPATMIKEYWNGELPWLSSGETGQRYINFTEKSITKLGVEKSSTRLANKNSTVVASAGQGYTRGQASYLNIDTYVNQSIIVLKPNIKFIDAKFLYFNIDNRYDELRQLSDGTSTRGSLSGKIMKELTINLPPLATQQKIAKILSSLDDKIELNNKINDNLEQQAQAIFKEMFGNKIQLAFENDCKPLGEIVSVIDNRGKTPALEATKTDFPIIDVGTLNSPGRIINYKDCTKYVSKTTYETFFRAGHPQKNDILLSTVGCNLALLKYYIGNVGCIAQNIVAFRSNKISSFYIYEYLRHIQPDLVSYDIGSAQPSIKVTHIIKHLIYIPTNDELSKFDSFAKSITEQIYNNVCENERLISLRDTLLPKLMSGEIDVESVKI